MKLKNAKLGKPCIAILYDKTFGLQIIRTQIIGTPFLMNNFPYLGKGFYVKISYYHKPVNIKSLISWFQ